MKFSEYEKQNREKDSDWVFDFDFRVSHLVSEARLKRGLTQEKLAKLVGTQQPSIARVENGSITPSLDFLKKIALAIGTTLIPPRFGFMEADAPVRIIHHIEEKIVPYWIGVQSEKSANTVANIPQ